MSRAVGTLKTAGMYWGTLACGGPACESAPVHRLARKSRNSTAVGLELSLARRSLSIHLTNCATMPPFKDDQIIVKKPAEGDDEVVWEEDRVSEEGAIWPIQQGKIVDWPCFFALITHTYNSLNPPFHTPILLITQPAWTPREHEKLTQFFFEKFKVPAFGLMDAALATTWAYGVHTATVIDVGKDKADITAVSEFIPHTQGRVISLEGCGGEAFTQGLLSKLKSKGLNRDMCEQLKRSPICELLPPGTPLPGPGDAPTKDAPTNPAAVASTGATGPGPAAAASIGNVPRGPGIDTEVGEDTSLEESEGVLDVASIVAGGKMSEYLAKKEKDITLSGDDVREGLTAVLSVKDHALLDTLKNMNLNTQEMADAKGALDEGPNRKGQENGENGDPASATEANGTGESGPTGKRTGSIRREIEVGTERFMADGDGTLEKIADAVHRAISSIDEVGKRSDLWEQLIVCGNGSKLRGKFRPCSDCYNAYANIYIGFKESLLQTIQTKYLVSPSSATIFTSEIPSNVSTPLGTGAPARPPRRLAGQSAPACSNNRADTTHDAPWRHSWHVGQHPLIARPNAHYDQVHQATGVFPRIQRRRFRRVGLPRCSGRSKGHLRSRPGSK